MVKLPLPTAWLSWTSLIPRPISEVCILAPKDEMHFYRSCFPIPIEPHSSGSDTGFNAFDLLGLCQWLSRVPLSVRDDSMVIDTMNSMGQMAFQ